MKDFAEAISILDKAAGQSEILQQCLQIVRNDRKKLQNQLHVARRSAKTNLLELRELKRQLKREATKQLHADNVTVELTPTAQRLIKKSEIKKQQNLATKPKIQDSSKKPQSNEISFTDHNRVNCNRGF